MSLTQEQYENKIKELEKEIAELKKRQTVQMKRQQYGLTWIDVPEAFDKESENKIPVLEEVKDKAISNNDGKPTHILIEGDNYHALQCLNYTHKGKVDVIYIDPPYNTGSDGFRYKDARYILEYPDGTEIPKEHPLRHSYWLSFMEKRLKMAKSLLTEDGVLFISIDENEQCNLQSLCEKIFPNKVEMFVWRKSGIGRDGKMKNTTTFRIDHEYIIVCYKNLKFLNKSFEVPQFENNYSNPDNDPRGPYKAGSISNKEEASNPNHPNYYTVVSPSGKSFTRQFNFSKEEFDILNNDNRIYWGKNGDAVPASKIFVNEKREVTTSSIIDNKESTTTAGSKELEDIMDNEDIGSLMRPKPTSLIMKLIHIGSKKNSTVLDFFAGSGTTLHATMKLNAEDGGNRQCILVQLNENNICEEVTYERNKRVIQGYTNSKGEQVPGLGNSLKYYKTAFVGNHDASNATDDDCVTLAKKAGCLLSIGENTLDEIQSTDFFQIYEDKNSKLSTAIYFTEELSHFDEFVESVKKVASNHKTVIVYTFSWSSCEDFIYEFEGIPNVEIKAIPQPILEIYKSIYQK